MIQSLIPSIDLRLCDDLNRPGFIVNTFTSLQYTHVWGDADEFILTIPRSARYAEELLVGRIILMPVDTGQHEMRALVIRQIRVNEAFITVSGTDYLWDLLGCRLILDGTDTGSGYDTKTAVIAETAARHFMKVNCLEADDEHRRDPFIRLEPERAVPLGTEITLEGRFQTLGMAISSICTQGGVNVYGAVVEDETAICGWYIEARFEAGVDHSQSDENPNAWVVLSEEYGNAILTEYIDTLPSGTVAIVRGAGAGASRLKKTVGDETLAGIFRREIYVDASDCRDDAAMQANGEESLKKAVRRSIELKLTKTEIYGTDFRLGDTVTCDLGMYGSYAIQVTKVVTEYTGESTSVSVNLGADIGGVMSVIRDAVAAIPLRRQ